MGNGAKQCIYQALLASCSSSDGVVISAPYWPSYPKMALLVGATPIILETSADNGYLINPQSLDQCLADHPRAKALILGNPSNPTGGVHSTELLSRIAEVLEKYPDVVVMADKIYERLISAEGWCTAFTALSPFMFQRTIALGGFLKSHAMTGFRLGYLAAPRHYARAASILQGQLTGCASSVSQAASVAALRNVDQLWLTNNASIMMGKRDYVLMELLRARLLNRNTKMPQSLELGLRNSWEEMEYGLTVGNFDAVIVNDNLDRACDKFTKIVEEMYACT